MSTESAKTRVQQWVENFSSAEDEIFHEVGENFEYYLDHVDELESGEFDREDLPHLDSMDKLLIHSGVLFGIEWGKDGATLYAVSDSDGNYECLYAHAENAARHVAGEIDGVLDIPNLVKEFPVRQVTPQDADARAELSTFLQSEHDHSNKIGECLLFLLENEADIEAGTTSPDDFPHYSQNVKWLLAYSALFGRLWECSHPGLWVVLDADGGLVNLFGSPGGARSVASETAGATVDRVNVMDGDLPNAVVLDADHKGPDR